MLELIFLQDICDSAIEILATHERDYKGGQACLSRGPACPGRKSIVIRETLTQKGHSKWSVGLHGNSVLVE